MNIPIISAVTDLASSYIKGKQELKTAKIKAEATARLKSADNLADWERIRAKDGAHSWKDEYIIIVLSIPLIGCFVPALVPYVGEGFKVLATTPEWYRWLVGSTFAASFGIRFTRKL